MEKVDRNLQSGGQKRAMLNAFLVPLSQASPNSKMINLRCKFFVMNIAGLAPVISPDAVC